MLTQPRNSWPKNHENHVKSVCHYSVHKSELRCTGLRSGTRDLTCDVNDSTQFLPGHRQQSQKALLSKLLEMS